MLIRLSGECQSENRTNGLQASHTFLQANHGWPSTKVCRSVPLAPSSHGTELAHSSHPSPGSCCTCQCFVTSTIGSQLTGTRAVCDRILSTACCSWFDFRPETTKHAMMCIARLVRALLGESAISARKLECGPSLTVLGIDVCPGWCICSWACCVHCLPGSDVMHRCKFHGQPG